MTEEELNIILQKHKKWLKGEEDGKRADLHDADLHGMDLSYTDLHYAELSNVNLRDADLYGAILHEADLSGANLSGANLRDADLYDANLYDADLSGADLSDTDLRFADLHETNLQDAFLRYTNLSNAVLYGADLRGADFTASNLADAKLDEKDKYRLGFVVEIPIKGWKKCKDEAVVELEIPSKAVVFCINGKVCRTNIAKVINIVGKNGENKERAVSWSQENLVYKVGETIEIKDFDLAYNRERVSGIHFFLTKEEAEK